MLNNFINWIYNLIGVSCEQTEPTKRKYKKRVYLSAEDKKAVFDACITKEMTKKELALKYNISYGTVCKIARGL